MINIPFRAKTEVGSNKQCFFVQFFSTSQLNILIYQISIVSLLKITWQFGNLNRFVTTLVNLPLSLTGQSNGFCSQDWLCSGSGSCSSVPTPATPPPHQLLPSLPPSATPPHVFPKYPWSNPRNNGHNGNNKVSNIIFWKLLHLLRNSIFVDFNFLTL